MTLIFLTNPREHYTFLPYLLFPRMCTNNSTLAFLKATRWLLTGKPCSVEGRFTSPIRTKKIPFLFCQSSEAKHPVFSHRWAFPMNQCPHATFQKPHPIFMMRINTILLTAQNLISVFYKSKTTPPLPLGWAMRRLGQGVRRAQYSLINNRIWTGLEAHTQMPQSHYGLLSVDSCTTTKHSGVKYQGHNNCTLRVRQFHFLLSQRRKPHTWISDASRLCLDLLLPVTSHALHIEALII